MKLLIVVEEKSISRVRSAIDRLTAISEGRQDLGTTSSLGNSQLDQAMRQLVTSLHDLLKIIRRKENPRGA